ncbi:MAG: hypothetical protein R3C53_00880 [Pirellulaceae bacterium]
MSQFYVLSRDYSKSSFAYLQSEDFLEQIPPSKCPICGEELTPAAENPNSLFTVRRHIYGDLISDGSSIAVSPQFIAKYQASSLVGLDFAATPLRLSNCDREYFLAIPAATCTLLDEIKSGVVINQMRGCDCCRVSAIDKIDQLVINTATWKGDDIFCSGNLFSEIIVTQAFCDFIAKHDLSNFQFIPSSKFSFDYT